MKQYSENIKLRKYRITLFHYTGNDSFEFDENSKETIKGIWDKGKKITFTNKEDNIWYGFDLSKYISIKIEEVESLNKEKGANEK